MSTSTCSKNEYRNGLHEIYFNVEKNLSECMWCYKTATEIENETAASPPSEAPTKRTPDMQRYFGTEPGGGILTVHLLQADAFGVIGRASIVEVLGTLKKARRRSFKAAEGMMKAFKLLSKDERLLSVSFGSDSLGNEQIVVVGEQPGPEA